MALSFRAASGGTQAGTTAASQAITLPTGTAAGDLVYFVISIGVNGVTGATAAGWTMVTTDLGATPTASCIVGYRTIRSGDTAPTVTWTGTGKVSWNAIALSPAAGNYAAHSGFTTAIVGTTTATSRTPNSYVAGALSGASVILNAHRASGTGATAIATTPPSTTPYTEPTNGDQSTATGTTTATRQVATEVSYRLAQTGTITPSAETVSVTSYSVVQHAFAVEVTPGPKMATLTDDFTTQDTTKWTWGGAAAATGGQLVLPLHNTYADRIDSNTGYDLTASSIYAQVVTPPNVGAGTTEMFMALNFNFNDASTTMIMDVTPSGGATMTLSIQTRISGGSTTGTALTFDPVAHAYVRIRESGGTVFFDTSPDASTWTNRYSETARFSVILLYPELGSGFYGTETTPGTTVWDNVNIVPAVGGRPLPVRVTSQAVARTYNF